MEEAPGRRPQEGEGVWVEGEAAKTRGKDVRDGGSDRRVMIQEATLIGGRPAPGTRPDLIDVITSATKAAEGGQLTTSPSAPPGPTR